MNRYRKEYHRIHRLLRPSPAEAKFLKVMGWWFFIQHDVRREYKLRGYCVDFAIPAKRVAIEVDGKNYHGGARDIIKDMALKEAGWYVYRIKAADLWREPKVVRKYIKLFAQDPVKYIKRYG